MGLRAIPAGRLLAAHAQTFKAKFVFSNLSDDEFDPIVVLSPGMYLPAVIAQAEAIAQFIFGSTEVLGVRRSINEMGLLGVESDVRPVDGSPQGVLRSLLLTRASEQVFNFNAQQAMSPVIDLARLTNYYRTEGAAAIRGECADVLVADVSSYNWEY